MRVRTLLLAGALAAHVAAQQAPTLRSGVRTVVVDVVVTARGGGPAPGLGRGDFEIFENGRRQTITTFVEVRLDRRVVDQPEIAGTGQPDVQIADGRLLLVIVDDAMMPPESHVVAATRDIARMLVLGLREGDKAALIFTQSSSKGVEPTDRQADLLAAVARIQPGMGGGVIAERGAVETIRGVAEALTLTTQRRAVIVFVSVGIPIDIQDLARPAAIGSVGAQGRATDLQRAMQGAIDLAHATNTPIYTFDPSGLGGLQPLIQRRNPRARVSATYERARPYLDFNEALAANTGGRAAVNTNAFGAAVERLFAETSLYYLLGFESTNPRQEGRFRRLQVKVKRPGLEVRARRGYREEKGAGTPERPPRNSNS